MALDLSNYQQPPCNPLHCELHGTSTIPCDEREEGKGEGRLGVVLGVAFRSAWWCELSS